MNIKKLLTFLRPLKAAFLIAAAVALCSVLLYDFQDRIPFIEVLENTIKDGYFEQVTVADASLIVIIELDGRSSSLNDDLIDTITFLKEKGRELAGRTGDRWFSVIGIDMDLFNDRKKGRTLAGAMKGAGPIVISSTDNINRLRASSADTGEIDACLSSVRTGYTDVVEDHDGNIRSVKLFREVEDRNSAHEIERLPSFALALTQIHKKATRKFRVTRGKVTINDSFVIPLYHKIDGTIRIFYIKDNRFTACRYEDMKKQAWDTLKGAIILIGVSDLPSETLRTPVSRTYPRVKVQAQILNTILNNFHLQRMDLWAYGLMLLVLAFFAAASMLLTRRFYISIPLIVLLIWVHRNNAENAFIDSRVIVPVVIPLLAVIVSCMCALLYRVREAERTAPAGAPPVLEKAHVTVSIAAAAFSKDEIIGRYRIIDKIGSGGMGDVYLVEHLTLKVRRALKIIKPEMLPNAEMRERFRQEAEMAARLSDPNIITIHNYDEIGNIPFIEMEYFESYSLRAEMAGGAPLHPRRALEIMDHMAEGLQCAHNALPRPMIHRDLKPENILISSTNTKKIKIIDFGLVKVITEGLQDMHKTMTPLGTPYYMAPEQIVSGEVGPSTDIYSLGVIVYEMLTGRKPFAEGSYVEILNAHLKTPPVPPSQINNALPPEVDEVLGKAMEKSYRQRYQSAREFHDALRKALIKDEGPDRADPLEKTI